MPQYFDRYINLVEDIELDQAFLKSVQQINSLDIHLFSQLKDKRYLPDKWTVNDIIQHIIDIERILCAGVLRFVRNSTISLYKSFDASDYSKIGINWKHPINVLAMGFNIIGHQIHHINFIKEKYYPLILRE